MDVEKRGDDLEEEMARFRRVTNELKNVDLALKDLNLDIKFNLADTDDVLIMYFKARDELIRRGLDL